MSTRWNRLRFVRSPVPKRVDRVNTRRGWVAAAFSSAAAILADSLAMKYAITIALQVGALVAINSTGHAVVEALHLPVPGNVFGMLFLLALLSLGMIRLEWIHAGASVLTGHLAFFFIPIAVGLMAFGPLFLNNGIAILATLVLSAVLGICASGFTSQALARGAQRGTP